MKTNCIFSIFVLNFFFSMGQSFDATGLGTPVDITGANGNCSSNGAISFTIPVTGVGILSASNALSSTHLTFSDCDGSGSNLNSVDVFLKAPDGTCTGIYDGGLSSDEDETVDFILTTSNGCLNSPNTTNMPQETGQNLNNSGSSGTFAATYPSGSQINLTTTFSGVNADGNWTLIFAESTSFEPCIDVIQLNFGDPTVTDQTGSGDNCVTPIIWDGSPICTTTSGMTSSAQMPGWAGPGASTFGTFAGGATCDYNAANNNDVWIEFVAQETEVCVNISGLDNSLQSVVVSDPNTDGDNDPCTGAGGGQYWTLESCSRPSIYTTTAGTQQNQNHCFTATIGQTYYLVVDGNGGAESSFYVSGIAGFITLPVELINFEVNCEKGTTQLNWQTSSEHNNDYFEIQRSFDGLSFTNIGKVNGAGSSTTIQTYQFELNERILQPGYYRLKQVDYDGAKEYSKIKYINCQNDAPFAQLVRSELLISNVDLITNCTIYDLSGRLLFQSPNYADFRAELSNSFYFVHLETKTDMYSFKVFNNQY